MLSFLGNNPENLFTIDVVCHGVPSQKLFNKYLEWLGNKNRGKIIYYGFRDKDVGGWTCGGKTKTKTKTKTKIINGSVDPYYSAFLRGETYRETCYKCKFSNVNNRPADMTAGDFWGIELSHPKFYSKYGVSCCLVNTVKGKMLFEKLKDSFEYIDVTLDEITENNENLLHPTARPSKRDVIYSGINDVSLDSFIKKMYAPIYIRIIRFAVSHIPFKLKVNIKKILRKLRRRV